MNFGQNYTPPSFERGCVHRIHTKFTSDPSLEGVTCAKRGVFHTTPPSEAQSRTTHLVQRASPWRNTKTTEPVGQSDVESVNPD